MKEKNLVANKNMVGRRVCILRYRRSISTYGTIVEIAKTPIDLLGRRENIKVIRDSGGMGWFAQAELRLMEDL